MIPLHVPRGIFARSVGRRTTEFLFHIDVSLVGGGACDRESYVPSGQQTQDPIASIDANSQCRRGSQRALRPRESETQ